jgi:hypothetical protein
VGPGMDVDALANGNGAVMQVDTCGRGVMWV